MRSADLAARAAESSVCLTSPTFKPTHCILTFKIFFENLSMDSRVSIMISYPGRYVALPDMRLSNWSMNSPTFWS